MWHPVEYALERGGSKGPAMDLPKRPGDDTMPRFADGKTDWQ